MSAIVLATLLAAAPVAGAPTYTPQQDAAAAQAVMQRIFDASSRALVQVGDEPLNAGAVISESGIIVASSTGLRDRKSVAITFVNGFKATADVVAVDEAVGVALLRANGLPAMAFVQLSPLPVQAGQASYAVHLARLQTPSVTFARIATTSVSREGHIDDRYFTAPYTLDPRMRGGPVVAYSGQMVGLLLTGERGVGFAVGARAILALLAGHAQELPTSELAVSTDPSGAEVLIDGAPQGKTPLTVPAVGAGEHLLTLRAPGLPDQLRRLTAIGPAHQALSATLLPGAPVRLDAPADAAVYVDGLLRSQGPATLWLPGGKHLVQALARGRRPFLRTIEVVEDRPLSLAIELGEARATLSVDTLPPGSDVMLDGNRIGATPLTGAKVTPGTYELSIVHAGFHTLTRAVAIGDGQDVNLGKLALEAPHGTLVVHAPPGSELTLDGGPRHAIRASEEFSPGAHRAVIYAPYQYAVLSDFRAEDGQTVQLRPGFVAAGTPRGKEITHTISTIVEGGAGILTLVSTGFFIAAEADRETSRANSLTPSGHNSVSIGLTTAAIGLGLYGASAFVDALQPTPDMGHDRTANGQPLPATPAKPQGGEKR